MKKSIQLNNQHFDLHFSGAVYWPEEQMLLISDVHLGKISHFRKYGSAVPNSAITENFDRLNNVIAQFQPKSICFLGDLFHSSLNLEWDLFQSWMQTITAKVVLVAGNHDIISHLKYEELGVKVLSELQIGTFLLTHHPEEREGFFNFCGHLHPGFKLRGLGRQQLNLRCFYINEQQLIFPAFGEFTGNYWINPKEGDRIFAITKKEVILVY
ncbi:ligase-associated DNA damage response endonuclease PdeM [Gillisia sp. M10.2A]|uniref:Ligase-associated DNA damage response endonuclease PdeM n=1 Tax=Gillisia lutea TaxID=2909668 RepID=A0ABS9EBT3_9FLAO|nr:ligase-associated DNA damage response endonuclease PdeM [Gillisia lutea]MCF4100340.1 ligase-associated DNA damage response endonuclease PdeM [Gillisia lutea]